MTSEIPTHNIDLDEIYSQFKELTSSIDDHQKLFKQKECTDTLTGLIICHSETTKKEKTPSPVSKLLSSKLIFFNILAIITQTRQLGN